MQLQGLVITATKCSWKNHCQWAVGNSAA